MAASGATDFDGMIEAFLAEDFEDSPATATILGVDGFDDRTADLSEHAYRERARREDSWFGRFATTGNGLAPDQLIDRDLLLSALRGRQILRDWEVWRRNPDVYLGPGLTGVFALFLHRLRPEPELVQSAVARLRAVPATLADARVNLSAELATPILVRRSVGQARAGARYARDLVPAEVGDDAHRAELGEAGDIAARAYEDFAVFLEALAERASCTHAIGEERYTALLEEKELLGYGTVELRRRGGAAYAELDEQMQGLAADLRGTRDWRAVVEALNADHPATPEEMRKGYEDWTQRARDFLVENELVSFVEGEECRVVPSPPFQRPVLAVASYFRPPAFKPSGIGHFFVPFPPDGTSPDEIEKRLRNNSWSSIPTIAVHEAYPGHHWQLVTALQNPRVVRRVFGSSYFTEGWGLYAEAMMREQGFFAEPAHELCHLDARIFRAARIVVDTSLHMGEMSVDEAIEFMHSKASLSEPTARAEVARYCAWPTQAASYLTGSLEIERMRETYLSTGRGDLRSFHDTLAASGTLPIALAERSLTLVQG